jgi:hypothetical protein
VLIIKQKEMENETHNDNGFDDIIQDPDVASGKVTVEDLLGFNQDND